MVSSDPPPRYAPLSWDQVRTLETRGIKFGPHGVTHPILSRTTDDRSNEEITGSWSALKSRVSRPVPIFAYPNGGPGDFGRREIDTLRRCGFMGAVTTLPGYGSRHHLRASETSRYLIPRFGFPGDPDKACMIGSGFWRLASYLRPGMRPPASNDLGQGNPR